MGDVRNELTRGPLSTRLHQSALRAGDGLWTGGQGFRCRQIRERFATERLSYIRRGPVPFLDLNESLLHNPILSNGHFVNEVAPPREASPMMRNRRSEKKLDSHGWVEK